MNKRRRQPGKNPVNCWEFNKCGREVGGHKVAELGICQVAICATADGLHSGANAGRVCWAIPEGCSQNIDTGVIEKIIDKCFQCEFFKLVHNEEKLILNLHDIQNYTMKREK